ncbi:MAG TPA: peptide ABC transporter substrate-binding protein [Verrucomicrobiae bacterium]|nr:peptide ABC transporter substrate-binding protein [Verrucomicrobiae bacterium]
MSDLPERDWKLLQKLKPVLLDRLCGQILQHAVDTAGKPGMTNHDRYLKLFHLIQEQNQEIAFAFDNHRRSTALMKILQLRKIGLFTAEEFSKFSEKTREIILSIQSR